MHLSVAFGFPGGDSRLVDPFCRSISRLSHKPDLLRYESAAERVSDLTGYSRGSPSWEECCARRALRLLEQGHERYYLSYSGGIDSSNALVAILRHWPEEALRRLSVWMSHESIRENPGLFEKHVRKLKLTSSYRPISGRLVSENALLITGELGDQLFGSDILGAGAAVFGEESLFEDYRRHAPGYIQAFCSLKRAEAAGEIFRRIEPIAAESPFPIRSTHDFFWWWNFTQKWQYVKFRFTERHDWDLAARYGTHVAHFYDDLDFQNWSLANHDRKLFGGWNNYKDPAKRYIADFSGDETQMRLVKVQSLMRTYAFTSKRAALDADYREVTMPELKNYAL